MEPYQVFQARMRTIAEINSDLYLRFCRKHLGQIGLLKIQMYFFKHLRHNSWVKFETLTNIQHDPFPA